MTEKTDLYSLAMLLDFYGQLLTKNQFECLDLHCNQDMSMSEIAEELGISRQGVYDFINTGRKRLVAYEEKLGLYSRFKDVGEKLALARDLIDRGQSDKASEIIDEVIQNGI